MKVLQINTVVDFGSTGRTVSELAYSINLNGDECYCAYGQKKSSLKNSFKIGTRLENHLHNIGSRIFGKQGYFTVWGTKSLIRYIETIQPDVIHLRNLHGNYLNLKILFNYLSKANVPVVWTLHDCWAFTGKCAHYTNVECYKWQTHCFDCPQVKKYPPSLFFDRSEMMFSDKKKWFTSVNNMTIITVSHWLAREAEKSFLSKYPIIPIYNWINQEIFKPGSSNLVEKYGISKNKFVILGISAGWGNNNTKLSDFIDLSKLITSDMQLILVGGEKEPGCIPKYIKHLPYINNVEELAQIYSLADVYVHLSVEDTFGKVIAEAMSCGTPAIVYNSTACPEIIGKGCGYVVEKRDISGIYKALLKIKKNGKQKYSAKCIQHVSDNFDYKRNTGRTIQLYKSLLNK